MNLPFKVMMPSALPYPLAAEHVYSPKSPFFSRFIVRFIRKAYSFSISSDMTYFELFSSFPPKEKKKFIVESIKSLMLHENYWRPAWDFLIDLVNKNT